MTRLRALIRSRGGTAAAEMALVLPFLVAILFGSVELGNYFWHEHNLVKSVRDGARYAARQPMSEYTNCSGSPNSTIVDNTKALVRTGKLSGGTDILPNWDHANTVFTITITCKTTDTGAVGGTALSGIYAGNVNSSGTPVGAPIITVTAVVPYDPVLDIIDASAVQIRATHQAAVMGI